MFPALNVISKVGRGLVAVLLHKEQWMYYWWMLRYAFIPRKISFTVRLPWGTLIHAVDVTSFFAMYKAIFLQGVYASSIQKKHPLIIDCGANIGLSVLYFQKTYPGARIMAYEPDPNIFAKLKQNLQDVTASITCIPAAVWIRKEKLSFLQDNADGGRVVEATSNVLSVSALRLRTILQSYRRVDILKVDIEGAEAVVLLDCEAIIDRVDYLFFEYHSFLGQEQRLGEILLMLERKGFRYYVGLTQSHLSAAGNTSMDLQVDIRAYGKRVQKL